MENVRKYQNINFCTTFKQAKKFINQPNFKHRTIFSKNLVAIHRYPRQVTFAKPIAIGMAVLDLSKCFMYEHHYNVFRPNFKDIILMYMDTDSFFYKICNSDFYEFMKTHPEYFDTSNYPISHPLYSIKNKKLLGKFKDELASKKIKKFIGLRSKMYAFEAEDDVQKKLKGIKKYVLRKEITIADYEQCLFKNKTFCHEQSLIRSRKHKLETITQKKISLSPNDTKRKILDDGISTYAHGHKRLRSS
jgi:hypothetical protein